MMTPLATGEGRLIGSGVYITIVSPVELPRSILNRARRSVRFVNHVVGTQVCSYSKTIQGATGQFAYLNGTTVALKVNGSNPFTVSYCAALQKSRFNPTNIGR
jgi:hypothetical protein